MIHPQFIHRRVHIDNTYKALCKLNMNFFKLLIPQNFLIKLKLSKIYKNSKKKSKFPFQINIKVTNIEYVKASINNTMKKPI